MEQKLNKVLSYFKIFDYYPNFEEIYTFFPEKINENMLKRLIKAKKYTPPQYSIRAKISAKKLQNWRFKLYMTILSVLPQVKLVGLSGSIAMKNAKLDDDIDLFIITKKDRLFTARFLATIVAIIMGLKRNVGLQKAPGKVCLNLFFDESNLIVPKEKKTEFVAHEILQMKPIINKENTYQRFLQANKWVFKIFPNALNPKLKSQMSDQIQNSKIKKLGFRILNFICHLDFVILIFNIIEFFLKDLELYLIRKHQTTEIITDNQLWFHPVDFGKKLKI